MHHDPGGKVRTPTTMAGGATFAGENNEYRLLLWRYLEDPAVTLMLRTVSPLASAPAFFIGMNPSTADADHNDPTITREVNFTRSFGCAEYIKGNVSAYRATDPKMLKKLSRMELDYPDNFPTLLRTAKDAAYTVLAFGALRDSVMSSLAASLVRQLRAQSTKLYCLGVTKDWSPRHPLYLPASSQLTEWQRWA